MTALAILGIAPLAERWVAGGLGAGAISHLDYGFKLFAIPSTLFDASVAGVLQAHWARRHYGGTASILASVQKLVLGALMLSLVIAVSCWIERETLVTVMLQRGAFGAQDSRVVASLFGLLMLGFPTGMAALILERGYMAIQATRFLMLVAIVKIVVRLSTAIIGGARFGVTGIALAQPISSVIDLALLAIFWRRALRGVSTA
jgi:peptidoglycan biosynthesis protein MviN/MurJ (putative lipid II flippase)